MRALVSFALWRNLRTIDQHAQNVTLGLFAAAWLFSLTRAGFISTCFYHLRLGLSHLKTICVCCGGGGGGGGGGGVDAEEVLPPPISNSKDPSPRLP